MSFHQIGGHLKRDSALADPGYRKYTATVQLTKGGKAGLLEGLVFLDGWRRLSKDHLAAHVIEVCRYDTQYIRVYQVVATVKYHITAPSRW